MQRRLLEIADQVRAIATTGRYFTEGSFDRERYLQLLELAAQLGALATAQPAHRFTDLYAQIDDGYVTPKLDVRMAVFRDDAVLLVQERSDQRWSLPGGYVDIGDSPSDAAERETWEEAGLQVRAQRLAGVFDCRLQPDAPAHLFHIHKLVFTGNSEQGGAEPKPTPSHEILEARFWALADLPPLSLGRTLPLHIETARKMATDPSRPTHFD